MKTKIFAAVLALIIAASLLCACGNGSSVISLETLIPDFTAALPEKPTAEPVDSTDPAAGTETDGPEAVGSDTKDAETENMTDETDTETEPVEDPVSTNGTFKFKRTDDGETWLDSYAGKEKTVVIPSEDPEDGSPVVGIDVWAFRDNDTVRKIVVPDTVTAIEKNAFMYCTALEEIVLPKDLKTLGDQAFYRCSALKKVSIPEGVETLGYATFMFCEALEEVTLPKTLKEIGDYVFAYCGALQTINYRGAEANWGDIGISDNAMPPTWYTTVYGYAD